MRRLLSGTAVAVGCLGAAYFSLSAFALRNSHPLGATTMVVALLFFLVALIGLYYHNREED